MLKKKEPLGSSSQDFCEDQIIFFGHTVGAKQTANLTITPPGARTGSQKGLLAVGTRCSGTASGFSFRKTEVSPVRV